MQSNNNEDIMSYSKINNSYSQYSNVKLADQQSIDQLHPAYEQPEPTYLVQPPKQEPLLQKTMPEQVPSALYKKCFPNMSMPFKERFPVFADILSKYGQNVKKNWYTH